MPASLYNSLLEQMEGQPYGHYFSTWCPFDTHKTPAFLVFKDGLAKCLSCDRVWTHQQVQKKIGSHYLPKSVPDKISRVLPRWRKWEERFGDLDGIAEAAHRKLKSNTVYQTYLKRRKIYDFMDEGTLGFLDNWITFPVYNSEHRLLDIVVRSIDRQADVRYVVSSLVGDHLHLYVPSWKRISKSEEIYVVYGIIDSIALHLSGLPAVTGVTGKTLSPDILRPLNKRFLIIPDDGEEVEASRLANKLGWRAKVKKIDWLNGTKDCDEIYRKYGTQQLLSSLGA